MRKAVTKAACVFCLVVPTFLFPFYTQLSNPIVEQHVYSIRDPRTDRAQFRWHMGKIGEHLAVAIANTLPVATYSIETSLHDAAEHKLLKDPPVVITILRAGLPLLNGMLQVFPEAESGFFVYQRDESTLQPVYHASLLPSVEGRDVIIVDPMIATGGSILAAISQILPKKPRSITVACAIAAAEGLLRIHNEVPQAHIFATAVDPALNECGYIVPGLGDAGDRSFGKKAKE